MEISGTCTSGRIGRSSYIRSLTGAILVGVALTISSGQLFAAETDPCATVADSNQVTNQRGVPFGSGVGVSPIRQYSGSVVLQTTELASGVWTYELPYEQGRPVQIEQPEAGCDESAVVAAPIAEATSRSNLDAATVQAIEDMVSRHCTNFHDVGGPPYVDETCAAAIWVAAGVAHGWPNFDSTSIAIRAGGTDVATTEQDSPPSFSQTANGRSISLTESKEASGQVASSGYYVVTDEQGNAFSPERAAAGSTDQATSTGSASSMAICFSCADIR